MLFSSFIDDFARIMKDGNTGGYANNWLIADRKNNEVASLELVLKNSALQGAKDGFSLAVELRAYGGMAPVQLAGFPS